MDTAAVPSVDAHRGVGGRNRIFPIEDLGVIEYESRSAEIAQIAVVVPLYNYEKTIEECLESIVAQDFQPLSVVVVDDASTDRGCETAVALLRQVESRFANAVVVRHLRNQGLSMARNMGIARSDEPYLFMLDADNRIRRRCLSKLMSALRVSGAAFAYPQLRMFGEIDSIGLADVWDPKRLRCGNYIDAMALLRREALVAAGGYSTLINDYGWEDYDLWCHLAQLGFDGIFLPEILGEYRVHNQSMLRSQTNHNAAALTAELTMRYPKIFGYG